MSYFLNIPIELKKKGELLCLSDIRPLHQDTVRIQGLLQDVREEIDAAICEDPPFSVREGGMIRTGFSAELDELRQLRDHGAERIAPKPVA